LKIEELIRAARERTGLEEFDSERQASRPSYSLEDFGWTREEVAPHFEEYLANHPQAEAA
jgi:hypothetical protein